MSSGIKKNIKEYLESARSRGLSPDEVRWRHSGQKNLTTIEVVDERKGNSLQFEAKFRRDLENWLKGCWRFYRAAGMIVYG